ncbi:ArfGAP with FG repeats 1 [Linnemannia schmuckeri]|uniref:ArfGAP with FG repeats 1 n=1 Tax=Linnemannia schmuckeri TaxID=64567 RepID=A0A9P5VBV2_9FUNG|nr:ArfGAP with FG repeats 1 [Linnemannia schmuckeri]
MSKRIEEKHSRYNKSPSLKPTPNSTMLHYLSQRLSLSHLTGYSTQPQQPPWVHHTHLHSARSLPLPSGDRFTVPSPPPAAHLILTGLLKLPENKKCFDCPSKVNVYANLFNNTFICEKCSGLLRELNHRVKSISASTFTSEEMAGLQKGGNAVAKKIWLATWSWREYPEPDAHEVDDVRQFMRAKYVKKLWYQDPNGGSPSAAAVNSAISAPTSPTAGNGPNSALAVPERVRAISKSQSIDVNNHIASSSTPSAATPERTLSRKSSTLSSDSGSTTFSKSTDPSSAGSSPFHPAGAPKSAQPSPSQFQAQQQQQQQQQRRQGSFDNAMGLTCYNHNNNNYGQPVLGGQTFAATPAATETADPFSLMTNAFSNMGMNSSRSTGINSNDAFSTQLNEGYAGHSAFSQAQVSPSQAHSSNDFFSAFSQPSPSAALQATASNDPFSLASSGQSQDHQSQYQQQQSYMNHGTFQGLDFGGGVSSSAGSAAGTGVGAGMMGGAKSFDDYLSVLGQGQQPQQPHSQALASSTGSIFNSPSSAFSVAASSATTLSPQSTGSANPFGLQQQPPQQLQRAFTADYISTSTGYSGGGAISAGLASSGQQSNPFAMFAKQNQPQPSFSDPFGNMTVPQQYQQQQQQQQSDYFSTNGLSSSGTRSPNPFAMSSGGQQHGQSAPLRSHFDQQQQVNQYQQQQAAQPAFMRSASESSYNLQSAFGNNSNNNAFNSSTAGPPSSSIYESAFSMPGAPSRSMTVPTTISNSGAGAGGSGNMNDMFGQWMKPSPVAATSKYPSIDDLDPFSATLSSSSGAVHVSKTGTASVIKSPTVIPRPIPTPTQAMVKVTFADVNFYDVIERRGHMPAQLPLTLGHEAAGGIGFLIIQLAYHLGAHVIGVVSSDEEAALACANDADHVVIISSNGYAPLEEAVSTLVSGKGVHAVYDSVGQATFESHLRIVRRQGTVVSYGFLNDPIPPLDVFRLASKNIHLTATNFSQYLTTRDEFEEL